MGLAHLTKILQKSQRDLAIIMGTAAPGGGLKGRHFEVILGVQRIPCGRVRCVDDGFHHVFVCGITVIYILLLKI